ncbi:mynd domain [Fusarium longipes]|uniref:Mynd domain n=1 Tax=Fusarium longipes TaxID=694270 RepID=A0A395SG83_9HYPO|nr:mynd domain [Fusarium longipes]
MAACKVCQKTEPEVSLKRCAKCSSEFYCSRVCQQADWKQHKKLCGKGPSASASASAGSGSNAGRTAGTKGLDQPISNPFTRLDTGKYLHNRPEKDVYRLLIDAYRLRVEDMYKIEGEVMEHSLYSGSSDGLAGFRQFLDKTSTRKGLLPPWWTPGKQKECEEFGMTSSEQNLKTATDKADVIERYGDPQFPMQLRMLGESIYGTAPGGSDGSAMRKMLAAMEGGEIEGVRTLLDASRFR